MKKICEVNHKKFEKFMEEVTNKVYNIDKRTEVLNQKLDLYISNSERRLECAENSINSLRESTKKSIDELSDKKASKDSVVFLRNILIGSIIVTIFLAIILAYIDKILSYKNGS